MPQTIVSDDDGEEWIKMLGTEWRRVQEEWLHTPGNLTLVGCDYNIEMKNKPFLIKKSVLEKSRVYLNKYFSDKELKIWNEEAIKQRGQKLAEIAAKVWSKPEV